MLKFDSNHKSLKERIKDINWLKVILVTVAAVTLSIAIAGPILEMRGSAYPCDIDGDHAHLYIDNETKIERYIDSEYEHYQGLDRLEEYKLISQEDREEIDFMNKHDLFKIDENQDQLQNIEQVLNEGKEYRYSYTETIHYTTPIKVGKGWTVIHHYEDVTRHSWTNDENHENLTGETRDVNYMYYGYKVTNENGKYKLEESDPVESLSDLPSGYNYVSRDFYKAFDPVTKKPLRYEDGTISDLTFDNSINLSRDAGTTIEYVSDQAKDATRTTVDEELDDMLDDFEIVEETNVNSNTIDM